MKYSLSLSLSLSKLSSTTTNMIKKIINISNFNPNFFYLQSLCDINIVYVYIFLNIVVLHIANSTCVLIEFPTKVMHAIFPNLHRL